MGDLSLGLLVGFIIILVIFGTLAAFVAARLRRRAARNRRAMARLRAIAARRWKRLQDRIANAQRLAEIGTLTGGLAHEIKNPLSTIQLNLQLLQEDLNPDDPSYPRISHRMATVGREAGRLRDILDDFLRFAGKIELRRELVDLNKLLEELADFFSPQTQLNHVQLRLRPNPTPLVVSIDPRLIKQAVLNLMLNALQAMPSGGELILGAHSEVSHAIIDVIDTGPGIPADAVHKIFQAYYTMRKGGTGLGLAMTRRIVEEHGGEITVTSEVGKGSDFSVKLPLKNDPQTSHTMSPGTT